jgi:hypothetical protein
VTFEIGGHRVTATRRHGRRFTVHAAPGAQVTIPAGAARDRLGNRTGAALSFQA